MVTGWIIAQRRPAPYSRLVFPGIDDADTHGLKGCGVAGGDTGSLLCCNDGPDLSVGVAYGDAPLSGP